MNVLDDAEDPIVLDEVGPFASADERSEALQGDALLRYEWALVLGFDVALALRVAETWHCDLHQAHELLQRSCSPELAVELATPVRG